MLAIALQNLLEIYDAAGMPAGTENVVLEMERLKAKILVLESLV